MANKRKTTFQEIVDMIKESADVINDLISYWVSKNILSKTKEKSIIFYTLTPYGEEQLAIMSSKIIEGWKTIMKAVETKDVNTFLKMVKENEGWIKYLQYGKIISTEDADFVMDSYKKIIESRQKKNNKDVEIERA